MWWTPLVTNTQLSQLQVKGCCPRQSAPQLTSAHLVLMSRLLQ